MARMHVMSSPVGAPVSSRVGKGARASRLFETAGGQHTHSEGVSARESARVVLLGDFQRTIDAPQLTAHILLVDCDPNALRRVGTCLSEKGYGVAAASSFEAARKQFDAVNPDLVVAAVRLEAFNGLHLAAWLRYNRPTVPVIITHTSHDLVLEADAQRLGAT